MVSLDGREIPCPHVLGCTGIDSCFPPSFYVSLLFLLRRKREITTRVFFFILFPSYKRCRSFIECHASNEFGRHDSVRVASSPCSNCWQLIKTRRARRKLASGRIGKMGANCHGLSDQERDGIASLKIMDTPLFFDDSRFFFFPLSLLVVDARAIISISIRRPGGTGPKIRSTSAVTHARTFIGRQSIATAQLGGE